MPRLTVIERLELLKKLNRPSVRDYIPKIFTEFTEFHGDRRFSDDPAIAGGIGLLGERPVTIIAQVRGRTPEEMLKTKNAMPDPEGYRKALRLAKQAEKFNRPVICFIDTPGAYPGIGAEERGQGHAIAENIIEFMALKTPVISIVLGEGGSGGALAIGTCDELAMLENALYSVISPRGFASILFRDGKREWDAAELMKITAEDLKGFGICDAIISEGEGEEFQNPDVTAKNIYSYLLDATARLCALDPASLPASRYEKYRKIGVFTE